MRKEKPLNGKALLLKEAIFDKGVRISKADWSIKLYGDASKKSRIDTILRNLRMNGLFVVPVKPDYEVKSNVPGLLTPVTENREIARQTNNRMKSRIDGLVLSMGNVLSHELDIFPDMAPEIAETLKSGVESMAALHKYALAIEAPTYVKKQLPSNTSTNK